MAKRPRYSRWRRLPGVYRFGEKTRPDPNLEPQRLSLYVNWTLLDAAETLAAQAGAPTVQEYCTQLLEQAIEAERIRAQVASIEAQRGLLEGLQEIADDPEYLAEWSAQVRAQARARSGPIRLETPADPMPIPENIDAHDAPLAPAPSPEAASPTPPMTPSGPETLPVARAAPEPTAAVAGRLSPAAEVVLRHAVQPGGAGPSFLASLRRGESVAVAAVAELARALHLLESESRHAQVMDRRLVYALHRLAFESQVLHTDAWPGALDAWTVDTLRAVQEAVDRILSGQDIRYDSPGARLEIPR